MTENEKLKAELERVQKQCAAMREAIDRCVVDWKDRHIGLLRKALEPTQDFPTPDELRAKAETYNFAAADLDHALKSDAGANYVSKEQVKPLVEVLEALEETEHVCDMELCNHCRIVESALAHARTLGL